MNLSEEHTLSFTLDHIYLANLTLISYDPSKSTHFSNSSSLIEYIIVSNFIEAIDAGPKIFSASQVIYKNKLFI